MKIIVLNGSPKGRQSVTMQYVGHMQKKNSQHEFNIINIAQEIHQIEKKQERFDEIISAIHDADGVLWAFPLYVYLVHSNYMRFIELITERGAEDAFNGKYTAALSTSIHFFDNTAHSYMRAVCDDLGMKYTGFFAPAMYDLMEKENRAALEHFTGNFLTHIKNMLPTQRLYSPVHADITPYQPNTAVAKVDNRGKKVLVIADMNEGDTNLQGMVRRVAGAFQSPVEIVNLATTNIKGGCLGCIKCGISNDCAYGGSDDILGLYSVKIKNADIIIFAGALKGRFLSARFKMFIDRRFFKTHQPQMEGKQVAYILSGPLGQNHNVLEVLQAITELDKANLAGIVTDEANDSSTLDTRLDSLAAQLVDLAKSGYVQPNTFLGVGGMKIFRDEIYGPLRFAFQADHKYYTAHGVYDFPQKKLGMRLQNMLMTLLTKVPPIRKQIFSEMPKYMVMPDKKIDF